MALTSEDVGSRLISKHPISRHRFGSKKKTGKAASAQQSGSPEAVNTVAPAPTPGLPPRSLNKDPEDRGL